MGRRGRHAAAGSKNRASQLASVDNKSDASYHRYAALSPSKFMAAEGRETEATRNPYTYRGPNAGPNPAQRLHQEFKSLSKEERQRLVEEQAAETDLLARTVHLRFLPTSMLQGELAALCTECGEYLRVRICGNSTNSQNWIYGFVEFAERQGAAEMMRRSGMELPNGPGKPPLRLKCNSAKQAIVDRVFHDADPATNMACIFGSGNFAHRTLKEAVESYYNLKKKECGLIAARNRSPNSSHLNNNNNVSGSRNQTIPRHHKDPYDSSTSKMFSHVQAGYFSHSPSNSDDESAGITPLTHFSVTNGIGSLLSDVAATTTTITTNTTAVGAAAAAATTATRRGFGAVTNASSRPLQTGRWTRLSNHVGGSSSRDTYSDGAVSHDGDLLPPVAAPFKAPSAGINSLLSLSVTPSHLAERGQALLLSVMRNAQQFIVTGEQFYDAIGGLRVLLVLLDQFSRCVQEAECSASSLNVSETQPRHYVEQLRLVAHLLLALLYIFKGNTEEAIAAIHNVVTCCVVIPVTNLQKPHTSPNRCFPVIDIAEQPRVHESPYKDSSQADVDPLAVGCDRYTQEDETNCTFNPLSQGFDFLGEMGISKEDEQEAAVLSAAMEILLADDQDDIPQNSFPEEERMYQQNVQFQSYVLNVLMTVGLSMELAHPVVSRCVYVLVSRRAKDVFGITLPVLEQTLLDGGVHRLRPIFFPQIQDDCFCKAFFELFDVDAASTSEMFFSIMPPLHMVQCFPPEGCSA